MTFLHQVSNTFKANRGSYVLYLFSYLLILLIYADLTRLPITILSLLLLLGFLLISFKPKGLGKATALIIITLGGASALLSPVYDVPDESAHFQRSLFLSEGDVNLSNNPSQLLQSSDFQEFDKNLGKPLPLTNLDKIKHSHKEIPNPRLTITNSYYILGYIPQAIGLTIGNALNINLKTSFILGRLLNVICYALIVFLAIKIAGALGQIIAVSALLPMNIYLAGSFSQDPVGIGIMLLIAALFCHIYLSEKAIGFKPFLAFILLCASLITIKLPFMLLTFLIVFIPNKKFDFGRYPVWLVKFVAIVLVCLGTIFWGQLYSEVVNVNYMQLDTLSNVDAVRQIKSVINKPLTYFPVIMREIVMRIIYPANINLFGRLTYGPTFLIAYQILFLGLVVLNNAHKITMNIMSRFALALVILGLFTGAVLAMYLTWTPVGSRVVEGMQDRYSLGVVVFMLILMVSNNKLFKQCQDMLSDRIILNLSICWIYTMLLSTLAHYYTF
ncbi:DUF2142 domain-containing protein [Streptococcus phocae]|uniref:DUF2142 domain-containing protein n=1 Tax=Streptococcus phocae TaxID=119224 RepID=UPI0006BBD897|nr:DUF2142 domain-containing protein [Streptococcus phocae]